MVELNTARKRARDQLLDVVAAMGSNLRSVEAIRKDILIPLENTAVHYEYPEAADIQLAVTDLINIRNMIQQVVRNCTEAAKTIATEG